MGEQHDLAETEFLQVLESVDDGRWGADQAALVEPECRYPETLLGELPDAGSDASSGASAITASTDSTMVEGSRPIWSHIDRRTETLCSSSPRA